MVLPSSLPHGTTLPPLVRIELRHGGARPVIHEVSGEEFLIGSVPGSDLRIPGANLPPILAQILRRIDGIRIRKLAPAQPILLNGQPVVSQAMLAHGDVIHIGTVELHIQFALASAAPKRHEAPTPAISFVPFPGPSPEVRSTEPVRKRETVDAGAFEIEKRRLEEQAKELEDDRILWYRRREEMEREWRAQQERLTQVRTQIQEHEQRLAAKRAELKQIEAAIRESKLEGDSREQHLERERKEVEKLRAELMRMRQEAGEQIQHDRQAAGEKEQSLLDRERQLVARERAVAEREAKPSSFHNERISLGNSLESVEARYAQVQRDALALEDHERQVDSSAERVRGESESLDRRRSELDVQSQQVAERTAELENQQTLLAALRTRLERLRDDLRVQSQQLSAERVRQEAVAAQLQERIQAADARHAELQAETAQRDRDRLEIEQRSSTMQAAVIHLRNLQERLETDERRLDERNVDLERQSAVHAEEAAMLKARAQQIYELQQRSEADRQSLKEREVVLQQSEETRRALAEQLRRRGEELSARSRALDEQASALNERGQELIALREQVENERRQQNDQLATMQQELANRAEEIQKLNGAVSQREENLRRHLERVKQAGENIATDRLALSEGRSQWDIDQQTILLQIKDARSELERFRAETLEQAAQALRMAPEAELRSEGAIERLSAVREQLKEHLGELHSYTRQSQEDLQNLRTQVQAETERLRQQELALQRARAEHRLAVTAFRQQLIEWQGRVGNLKHLFAQGESRLELKEQAIAKAAQVVETESAQLADESATLHDREREVAERKSEIEQHLDELKEWYRSKLRQLAMVDGRRSLRGEVLEMPAANSVNDPEESVDSDNSAAVDKSILSMTGAVDPADRQLGELLLSMQLIDADTLMPLWTEARRQRRSLRQILLSSGAITLYQLALIEAGNVSALMLGPYRVIDRLQSTPRETLYRVFDASRSKVALLRHLAEQEMHDALHPDEYRQRFGAAASVSHPNVAATYEVTEIQGRPAVLQEWVRGLPSSDWPALAAVPGVWYRLVGQAALALQAAHGAGLAHVQLDAQHLVLTSDGTLKITGFGEPAWLSASDHAEVSHQHDLLALGRMAGEWAMLVPRRKSSKPRSLPEALRHLLRRIGAAAFTGEFEGEQPIMAEPAAAEEQFKTAAELLDAMEIAGADLPANTEAWERLAKHVNDHVVEGAALRRTA
jgi:chromosome segregation ATPase